MPITLNEPTVGERIPVLKRRALGQSFTGALILTDQRDSQKKNDLTGAMEPVLKPNGKARQELIVRLVTITSTMPAGIGDDEDVPTAGAVLDRFLHHAAVIAITGESYRLKDAALAKPKAAPRTS